jgi:fibro-slime domain-containing protein
MSRTRIFVSGLVLVVGAMCGVGCAGVKEKPGGVTGGGGSSGGGANSGTDGPPAPVDGIVINTSKCGNGMLDPNEQCDDGYVDGNGHKLGGKGCSAICQLEDGWSCPTPGQPCVRTAICGDGVVEGSEQCDDGNSTSGDGCSATCMVETGYICRVPGKPCSALCGDGIVRLGKQCDDNNTVSGDGCSATCTIEPGWSCSGSPSVCVKSVCGNGKPEAGESCDCGTDPANLPSGCTGPNGLFNGDGTGCSKTCTKEPICRGTNGTGTTHACNPTCGNGNLEPGEQCDDGNQVSGDGCSSSCMIESGFTCGTRSNPDAQTCSEPGNSGQCLELPVKYRDFKNESVSGGHPDFFYYGATVTPAVSIAGVTGPNGTETLSYNHRYCVPNSAGPARQNDSTARCWDMAQSNLDGNGRPAFNTARNGGGSTATLCDCQFTDWSHDTNQGHVPGYTNAANGPLYAFGYVSGPSGHPQYKGPAPVVTSATTFGQWWSDGTYESDAKTPNKHAIATLELGPVAGATNLYRFSSAPHSVWGGFFPIDPAANNFPIYTATGSSAGPGTVMTTPAPWSEPLLCNLWPYWYSSAQFGAGAGCKSDQYVFAPSFGPLVTSDPGAWFGMNLNGSWLTQAQGWFHDSWFSIEARYLFAFNGAFTLQFFGDDDTFVFINGVLVIDLGGVHQRLPGKVQVDATGNATIQEGGNIYMACTGSTNCPPIPAGYQVGDIVPCDGSANAMDPVTKVKFNSTCTGGNTSCDCRQRTLTAAALGLAPPAGAGQPGNTYEIAVFSRDGHPTESNFQLTLSGFATTESSCQPRCGDGVVTGGEECDCGDGTVPVPASCSGPNDDTMYGGCTTQCKWGPYCGDAVLQNPPEDCDLGSANNIATYGQGGCTPGCKTPPYCGDGVVQTNEGEQCDLGSNNGPPPSPCSAMCTINIL